MADEPVYADESEDKLTALRDLPLTAESPGFRPDELIACTNCSRENPPNRVSCLYCGTEFDRAEIRTDLAQVNFLPPEPWEDGFSVVYAGSGKVSDDITAKAAEILRLEADEVARLLRIGSAAPVAYLRSLADADLLARQLSDEGFECAITGDDLLTPTVQPTRVRSIEFGDDSVKLVDFNTGNAAEISRSDRALLVSGTIFISRSETEGKRSRKRTTTTDKAELSSDETVLDIYPPSDVFGFRIRSAGFDFSCLGDEMGKLASENMTVLTRKLRESLPANVYNETYQPANQMLDQIWPLQYRNESSEVLRGTFGGARVHRVTVADNTAQFTRFSRLQRHFL